MWQLEKDHCTCNQNFQNAERQRAVYLLFGWTSELEEICMSRSFPQGGRRQQRERVDPPPTLRGKKRCGKSHGGTIGAGFSVSMGTAGSVCNCRNGNGVKTSPGLFCAPGVSYADCTSRRGGTPFWWMMQCIIALWWAISVSQPTSDMSPDGQCVQGPMKCTKMGETR